MRETSPPSPAVVVGIDGSRSGVDAALWAIDEAVERDLPLRLLYAIEPRESDVVDCQVVAHDFATAEAAVRYAAMAIESVDQPVKIEVEIVQDRAVAALVTAARSAAMVCVGALGINGAGGRRVGSTVSELVARAHCPVAIVRAPHSPSPETRWVVAEFDDTPEGAAVMSRAVAEARLRSAPLRVLTCWRPDFPEIQDTQARTDSGRIARANLQRALAPWRALHPELDIQAVAAAGNPMNYLARHIDSIGLIVLRHRPSHQLSEFAGRGPHATLDTPNCSVLICERHVAP